jgi:peptidoglycan hydrolase-like protein with peptidoglycan-binding domain
MMPVTPLNRALVGAAVIGALWGGGHVFAAAPPTTTSPVLVGLTPGQSGSRVYTLQADLNLAGYHVPETGVYDPATWAAVRRFEDTHHLPLLGETTAAFRAALLEALGWSPAQVEGTPSPSTAADSAETPLTAVEAQHPAVAQLLGEGASGHWVATLQADLNRLGSELAVDGLFGPKTLAAVQQFQAAHGLTVTGTTTPATWEAILEGLGLLTTGSAPSAPTTGGTAPSGSGVQTTSSGVIDGRPVLQVIHMVATAYGPSLQDNYPYGPVDYFGQPLEPGMVAVDPSVIPLGTYVYVTGYTDPNLPAGGFLGHAMDTGGAIKGDRIDIYMDASPTTVSNFGIESVTVYVLGN